MEPTTRRTSEALAKLQQVAGQVSHATPSAKDSVREKNSRSHVPLVVCYLHIMNLLKLAAVNQHSLFKNYSP